MHLFGFLVALGSVIVGACAWGSVGAAAAGEAGSGTGPLVVATSVAPEPVFFGDLVVAKVTVNFDVRSVSSRSVALDPDFVPYAEVGAVDVSRSRAGTEQTDVFRYVVQCVSDGCLPGTSPLRVQFPHVLVSALAGSARVSASAEWPAVYVASRLEKADLASGAPPFRWPTQMPPVAYGVRAGLLGWVLIGLGVVFAAAGLVFVGLELLALRARARRRAAGTLSPVEAAIAYTREAAGRADASDRRKAIGLLARVLAAEGHDGLADSTNGAAWSVVAPSPSSARVVADDIEAALDEGEVTPP